MNWVGRDIKAHLALPSLLWAGFPVTRSELPRAPSSMAFNTSRDGDINIKQHWDFQRNMTISKLMIAKLGAFLNIFCAFNTKGWLTRKLMALPFKKGSCLNNTQRQKKLKTGTSLTLFWPWGTDLVPNMF